MSAYKITDDLVNYIIEQKKLKPNSSCRKLSILIQKKFQADLSKSTINKIIKDAGLSLSTGRRPDTTPAPPPRQLPATQPSEPVGTTQCAVPTGQVPITDGETISGAILRKAADYLLGGANSFNTLIEERLQQSQDIALTEALIYLSDLKDDTTNFGGLCPLLGKKISVEEVRSYLNVIQSQQGIAFDIAKTLPALTQEVRCMKIDLRDGGSFYIDGQFRTVWSTQYLPYDFSVSIYNIKDYINSYFYENNVLNLLMAPGGDFASKEFFDFIAAIGGSKKMELLTLYGGGMDVIKAVPLHEQPDGRYIFGLWPWQYADYRVVKKLGEFEPCFFEPLQRKYLVAPVEIDLIQPIDKQHVGFRGSVIKDPAAGKICMIVLSNLPVDKVKAQDIARMYLNHWPNLIEAYRDFNRKLEFFTYVGGSHSPIELRDGAGQNVDKTDLMRLFGEYGGILDIYVKRNFLPDSFDKVDVSRIREIFYNIRAFLKQENDFIRISFEAPPGFAHHKDLDYTCRRLNEREIKFYGNVAVWFETVFPNPPV